MKQGPQKEIPGQSMNIKVCKHSLKNFEIYRLPNQLVYQKTNIELEREEQCYIYDQNQAAINAVEGHHRNDATVRDF